MSREVEVMRGRGWWEDRGGLVDDLVEDLVGDWWCRGRWGVLDGDVGGGVVEDVDDMVVSTLAWVWMTTWDMSLEI